MCGALIRCYEIFCVTFNKRSDSMKKIVCILLLLSLSLCGCFPGNSKFYDFVETEGWKEVLIENSGTLKVPGTWDYYVEDEIMYFVQDGNPVMISYDGTEELESNAYFSDFKLVEYLHEDSGGFSTGSDFARGKFLYQGEVIERYCLSLPNDIVTEYGYGWYDFIIWDTTVEWGTLITMAKEFEL